LYTSQQRSVSLALAPLLHDGVKVNLIDTPGDADFVGELRAGLRAAGCAPRTARCSSSPPTRVSTRALWHECNLTFITVPGSVAM
jgi:elongation factor G